MAAYVGASLYFAKTVVLKSQMLMRIRENYKHTFKYQG